MLRALIFDVDGTLCETEEYHRRAFNRAFAEAGVNWFWSQDDYRRLLLTTGGKERMRAHRADLKAVVPGDAQIARLHAAKTQAYLASLSSGKVVARPGVNAVVAAARAKGLRLAVATTTSPANVEGLVQAIWGCAAASLFEVIAAGDEVAVKKPAPDVYLLALQRLGVAPAEALAFEDSRNGLLAARAAGLAVIVTPGIYTAHEDFAGAKQILPDLSSFTLAGHPLR